MNSSQPSGMNVSPPSGMITSPPSGMNVSPPSGMMSASPVSLAQGPTKPLSLTMLAGYILAGVVLIGLIVMLVLYFMKTNCRASCPEDNTGLKWDASLHMCTVADDWSDVTGKICPTKCKLADSVNALCPYGYWAQGTDYDTRYSSGTGVCIRNHDVIKDCASRNWNPSNTETHTDTHNSTCCGPSNEDPTPECKDVSSDQN
jgi:hypothetical protein